MKKNLQDIVDLERYPINNLESEKIKNIIKKCKADLDQYSCSTIPKFIPLEPSNQPAFTPIMASLPYGTI